MLSSGNRNSFQNKKLHFSLPGYIQRVPLIVIIIHQFRIIYYLEISVYEALWVNVWYSITNLSEYNYDVWFISD